MTSGRRRVKTIRLVWSGLGSVHAVRRQSPPIRTVPRRDPAGHAGADPRTAYGKISIEGIAARAKVGKQTIYRWWRSKGALVVDALHEQNAAGAQEALALPDTGDLAADMRLVLRATVDEFTSPDFEPLFRALSIESLQDPALREQIVERIYRPQFEFVATRFRSAQDAGQVRPDVDLALAFELFMAPMFYRWQSGAHPSPTSTRTPSSTWRCAPSRPKRGLRPRRTRNRRA